MKASDLSAFGGLVQNSGNEQLFGFLTKDRFKNTDILVVMIESLLFVTGHQRALFLVAPVTIKRPPIFCKSFFAGLSRIQTC
jgi:hypothetical protein